MQFCDRESVAAAAWSGVPGLAVVLGGGLDDPRLRGQRLCGTAVVAGSGRMPGQMGALGK